MIGLAFLLGLGLLACVSAAIQRVSTPNFTRFVSPEAKFSLVHFYDPHSRFYAHSHRQEVEKISKVLQRFASKIQLAQVNVESDPYLQFAFGSQHVFARHHSKPFVRFDLEPLHVFPSVIKLYRNGTVVDEFVGEITANDLAEFVTPHLVAGRMVKLSRRTPSTALPFPKVVGCWEDEWMQDMARELAGRAYFGGHLPCPSPNRISIWRDKHTPELVLDLDHVCVDRTLVSHAIAPFLLQLTPENFWYLVDKYRYLGIVFSPQAARHTLAGVNAAVQFVSCEYDLFASQFQARSNRSLVLYDSLEKRSQVVHNLSDPDAIQRRIMDFIDHDAAPNRAPAQDGRTAEAFLKAHALIVTWAMHGSSFPSALRRIFAEHGSWIQSYAEVVQDSWDPVRLQRGTNYQFPAKLEDYAEFLTDLHDMMLETIVEFADQVQSEFAKAMLEEEEDEEQEAWQEIPRVAYDTLTTERFLQHYAQRRLPVIVTGLPLAAAVLALDDACEYGSNQTVRERMMGSGRPPVWSLPMECPRFMLESGFAVPKYLAGDLMQRASSELQHQWPTVNVGARTGEWRVSPLSTAFASVLMESEGGVEWQVLGHLDDAVVSRTGGEILRARSGASAKFRGTQQPGELVLLPAANMPYTTTAQHSTSSWDMAFVHPENFAQHLQSAVLAPHLRYFGKLTNLSVSQDYWHREHAVPFAEFKTLQSG